MMFYNGFNLLIDLILVSLTIYLTSLYHKRNYPKKPF